MYSIFNSIEWNSDLNYFTNMIFLEFWNAYTKKGLAWKILQSNISGG